MRAAILGLAGVLVAGNAFAADYLRGSTYEPVPEPVEYRWSGVYFGAHAGYTEMNAQFRTTGRPAPAPFAPPFEPGDTSTWPSLPQAHRGDVSYGGFIGYNAQWDSVVLGVEAGYSHTAISAHSSIAPLDGTPPPNFVYNGIARLTDFGTFRLRAGYAWGWVMPYAFVGLAVGRFDTIRSVELVVPPITAPYPVVDRRTGVFAAGFTLGGGVDVALTRNIFLRGEYEFIQLTAVNGVEANMSTIRGGAGFKF